MNKYWNQIKVTWDCGHVWIQTITNFIKKHPEHDVRNADKCPYCNEKKIKHIEKQKIRRLLFTL